MLKNVPGLSAGLAQTTRRGYTDMIKYVLILRTNPHLIACYDDQAP